MAVQFNFPPESYSAVYTADGTTNANVVVKCNVSDSCEVSGSPVGLVHTPPSSLFSCFHCANGINFTRKEKRRKENHTANHKIHRRLVWQEGSYRRAARCQRQLCDGSCGMPRKCVSTAAVDDLGGCRRHHNCKRRRQPSRGGAGNDGCSLFAVGNVPLVCKNPKLPGH